VLVAGIYSHRRACWCRRRGTFGKYDEEKVLVENYFLRSSYLKTGGARKNIRIVPLLITGRIFAADFGFFTVLPGKQSPEYFFCE
jgi:hypothetical protein